MIKNGINASHNHKEGSCSIYCIRRSLIGLKRSRIMYCTNYVVQKGDTLYSISRRFHVRLDAIMAANPLINVYNLMIGETICIPVSIPSNNYSNYMTYLVADGDTLGSVLNQYGVNLADLMQVNTLNQMYLLPGTSLQLPIPDEGETVDTL